MERHSLPLSLCWILLVLVFNVHGGSHTSQEEKEAILMDGDCGINRWALREVKAKYPPSRNSAGKPIFVSDIENQLFNKIDL